MGYKMVEYQCQKCDNIFEDLASTPVPSTKACPKCTGEGFLILSAVKGKVVWGYVDSY